MSMETGLPCARAQEPEGFHLLKRRAGRVAGAEGNACRAAAQRFVAKVAHHMRLCACGGFKGFRDACRFAQSAQTDQLRLMDGELGLGTQKRRCIERRKAAVAADACRNALQQRERAGVLAAVDMPMRVDETGADETARSVERLHAAGRVTAAREDGFDFFTVAEDVCAESAERFGVDDRAAGNEEF